MDNLSEEDRRRTMSAVHSKNTSLERRLYSMLAGMGCRGWTKNDSTLPGKPDAAIIANKVAIFVDGCFWHGCPVCAGKKPSTNTEYWSEKLRRNQERDIAVTAELTRMGWTVVRIWEHELSKNADYTQVRVNVMSALQARNHSSTSGLEPG